MPTYEQIYKMVKFDTNISDFLSQEDRNKILILDLSEDNKFWEDEEKAEQEFIKSQEEAYFNHN